MPTYDESVNAWVAPFVMAPINTKNVHRTNFLLDHGYGADFVYDEMMVVPGLGEPGRAAAEALAKLNPLTGDSGPKPGEGPTKDERESGNYDLLFVGEMPDGARVEAVVTGDRDPGYGSTSNDCRERAVPRARRGRRRRHLDARRADGAGAAPAPRGPRRADVQHTLGAIPPRGQFGRPSTIISFNWDWCWMSFFWVKSPLPLPSAMQTRGWECF